MADIVEVSTREFSRQFAEMKRLARTGTKLRVRDRGAVFAFELLESKAGFLGCVKGTLRRQSKPELLFSTGEDWTAEQER